MFLSHSRRLALLASSVRGQILSSEMSSASAAPPVQAVVRQLSDDPEAGISNLQMEPMGRPDPSNYPESSVIVRLDPKLSDGSCLYILS